MGSWKEDEKDRSIGTLAINLIELKEALLSRIEAMETALWEAKSTASHDAQQVEELKVLQGSLTAKIQELEYQKEGLSGLLDKHNVEFMTLKSDTETRVGKLEAHLQEMEETLRTKESASSQLQENFTAKIQELEQQKENLSGLLDQHNAEIRSQAEARVGMLEAQLRETEESLTAEIRELEHRLAEKEDPSDLLDKQKAEIRSQAEAKVGMLEAQLRETEESLTAEIRELEDQLTEKESLLEDRQEELNDLRSKSGALGDASDGVLTLKEEDVVTINLLGHKGEKVITPSMGEEKMAKDRKDTAAEAERLRAQIQERDTMLAAKETEVKMINRTMEEELSRQLLEKEESLRTRESAAKQQEDILTARIHDLENRLREKEALLEEGEGKDFQQSLSNELESLKAELRDRNLLLQARETEVRMIKQSLNEKFRGLERIAQSSAGKDLKKSRLGSFLETIEKKN
ncbi:MAG: hypothetical protein O6918_15360 [Deltaproteobacteria bacterium]|nr:hypothetical protein [Deltaproteobacteria bacterium]